jgi:[glutamine synthetase] adenylyltransferase / [glutamine synthetase]-adenylyl-L-tyrosine phosphorylase
LYRVWCGSEFVAKNCILHPDVFQQLVDSGDLFTSYEESTLHTRCLEAVQEEAVTKSEREATLHRQLRRFRRYEMLRIIWRDLSWRDGAWRDLSWRDGAWRDESENDLIPGDPSRAANLIETTRDMSRLADAAIHTARDKLHGWLGETWGRPVGKKSGTEQHMLVLGMGKLGADELNVSSDIDLIFAYLETGETQGTAKQLGNQEFFIRLAQKLIQALDNQTVDGQVFRVDMRLRPYGSSGALVLSFDALEEYYQTQGRDWERYAMIKSRVIGSDEPGAQMLLQMLRDFTYRRYTDFSAFQSLRDMKAMINLEVERRGLANNIKLGHGGIREIEFIAQAFQLVRGGRDQRFQNRRLRDILLLLDKEEMLPGGDGKTQGGGERLWLAYVFLRNLEHVLQAWQDQQTQELPGSGQKVSEEAELHRMRVAAMMGFASWQAFFDELTLHRNIVSELFRDLVAETEQEVVQAGAELDDISSGAAAAWAEDTSREIQLELERLGYDDAELAAEHLHNLRASQKVQGMAADTRARLDRLLPEVIAACSQVSNSTQALTRVLSLVESVARRSAYLVLLLENTLALKQLVDLCAASPWISQSLSRNPVLLDELLDARALFAPPNRQDLRDELRQQLLRIPEDDLEAQMEALRYFRLAHGLRVAACEVMEVLPLMKVSDYLTCLAEVILDEVLILAWQQLIVKYGQPGHPDSDSEVNSDDNPHDKNADHGLAGFLVIAYGKLGGIELGHGSDLDLVFLHSADTALVTTGERCIDNETFFVRLGQRVIHILNTVTPGGVLYEVDMRLRPSGNSGMLVSSIEAFEKYQQDSAWTWEHQALVRARPVAGDSELANQFNALRHDILVQERDIEDLRREVMTMRRKMTEHLGLDAKQKRSGQFDLKQDPGGIVDIEFMVQFAVLAQAHFFPALTQWSDNIRILALLSECEVLTEEENRRLTEAYIAYRSAGHRLQLQQEPNIVAAEQFDSQRQSVLAVWQKLFGEPVGSETQV